MHEVNIWTDRQAAGTLRRLAGGNETVPTVVIGDTALVNPSAAEVVSAARGRGVLPAGAPPAGRPRRLGSPLAVLQWVLVVALVTASFVLDVLGHTALSWAVDGVAVAGYFGVRGLRRRLG